MATLLHTSFAAIPLILGIALARKYLREKMKPQIFELLWGLALCRLLIPLWIPLPSERVKPLLNHVYGGLHNSIKQMLEVVNEKGIFLLWLVGTIGVLILQLARHFQAYLNWREALPLDNPAAEIWLAQHPCRRRVRVVKAQMR